MKNNIPDDIWALIKDEGESIKMTLKCRQGHLVTSETGYIVANGTRLRCKICMIKQNKDKRNRANLKRRNDPLLRRVETLQRYGLTLEEYKNLWDKQLGLCAICLITLEPGNFTQIDHCHITDKVRGLLCGLCNRGLGQFRDSITALNRAIEYLAIHNDCL